MSTGPQQPPQDVAAAETTDVTVVEATPDDVAALLTARTKDSQGRELGTWSDDTRPTTAQVQTRIDIARALVKQGLGPVPDKCQEGAETVVALLAAMITESAFWPEQTNDNQSTWPRLHELYLQARQGLVDCVSGADVALYGYELNVGGGGRFPSGLPIDFWQRDLDNLIANAGQIAP